LVFVPNAYHLTAEEEKARYDLHENNPGDQDYRRFLRRFFDPMNKVLDNNSYGLDFGSGPGPTLHVMFEEAGHTMEIYDIFFADDRSVLKKEYDFICATEVVEHLHCPMRELDKLWSCLKPKGYLGLMTKFVVDNASFQNWHYIRDDTHVTFFSKPTFQWIARQWDAKYSFSGEQVVIFQKP
jgi:hypothetical protein